MEHEVEAVRAEKRAAREALATEHWQVQDSEGNWHDITGVQAAAYRLEGLPVRKLEASNA